MHTTVTVLWLAEYSPLQCFLLCPNTNTWPKGLTGLGGCRRLLGTLTHHFSVTTTGPRWWVAPKRLPFLTVPGETLPQSHQECYLLQEGADTQEEGPQHQSVSAEKLLLLPIFSFGATVPRSSMTRAQVFRTVYSQTNRTYNTSPI